MSRYTLMDYFSIYVEEWDSLLEEFLRHLAMTSFSVVLALIIAVPLGIFITRNKAVSNVVIGIANVMQSIPCMALLAMGIPFLGVGETLAIFMVFVYAFLPILKNTYTGISGISPVSMEVARGIGLTRMQQLRRVELLHGLCRENAADAVIVCLMKFCDPEEYEYVAYSQELKDAGITVLSVDIDQQPNSYDQARTRIETLAEML